MSHFPTGTDQTFRGNLRATLVLGAPLAASQLAQLAINTTETIYVGWLGAHELAAAVLSTQFLFIVLMLGSGFLFAILPIAAQADGRGDETGAANATRMGLWFSAAYATAAMPLMWQCEAILVALGQDPQVAALAGSFMNILQWSLYPALATLALRSFMTACGTGRMILIATVAGVVANAILGYALVFGAWGAPKLGLAGAAIAAVLSSLVIFSILAGAVVAHPRMRAFRRWSWLATPDWPALSDLLRLGWPISATVIAEVGLFAAASLLVGWVGPEALAAHGIALQLASIAFMIPLGLSQAATVRIGVAAGRRDQQALSAVSRAAIALALMFSVVSVIAFVFLPAPLVAIFLDEANPGAADVASHAVTLVAIAAGFQFFDSLQVTAIGLLRGLRDTRMPMTIAVFAYWLVGMPLAWVLGFPAGLGAPGIWIGLAAGLAVAALLLTIRLRVLIARSMRKSNQAHPSRLATDSKL
ncbi:MAG: MATE family efflux transporter [Rhizobiaceae bacterium]